MMFMPCFRKMRPMKAAQTVFKLIMALPKPGFCTHERASAGWRGVGALVGCATRSLRTLRIPVPGAGPQRGPREGAGQGGGRVRVRVGGRARAAG